jgi:hypothetical protein
MSAVCGERVRGAVVAGLLCVLLGPVLPACSVSRTAPSAAGAAVASASATPSPDPAPSVRSVPAGTVIAPGATAVAGAAAGVLPARRPAAGSAPPGRTLRELQVNLCNSGEAGCYTGGRSIDEAGALIRGAARPDLVTLNEVCRRDVTDRLGGVLAGLWPSDDIVYLFAPAVNAAGGSYRCQNGDAFGNGLIARVPAGQLTVLDTRYGLFTAQATDIEQRTFGCVHLARFAACVTHLENMSRTVASTQCTTLMRAVVPALRGAWGAATTVIVAGDMNLDGDMTRCIPAGFRQVDDGGVQHVLGSAGIQFRNADRYPMKQTDHSALLVSMTLP